MAISARFSAATRLLFQQASLGILNSNAHFNALKPLPPWSLYLPLPLLFTCPLSVEEPSQNDSGSNRGPTLHPSNARLPCSPAGCCTASLGRTSLPAPSTSLAPLSLWWRTAAAHFPPLCAVFHPSSENHLLLVSNLRLCLGSKGTAMEIHVV